MDGPSPIPSRYPWVRRSMTSMKIATFFSLVRSCFVNVWEFLIGPRARPAWCFRQESNVLSGQFRETPYSRRKKDTYPWHSSGFHRDKMVSHLCDTKKHAFFYSRYFVSWKLHSKERGFAWFSHKTSGSVPYKHDNWCAYVTIPPGISIHLNSIIQIFKPPGLFDWGVSVLVAKVTIRATPWGNAGNLEWIHDDWGS